MEKNIIILTKSVKHSGYCIAGIDYETGEWIRLVSSNTLTEGAVPEEQLKLNNGKDLDIYDIICVDIIKSVATLVQPENHLYNEQKKWVYNGKSNLQEVIKKHGYDSPSFVFVNSDRRLDEDTIFNGSPSLLLLNIQNGEFFIKTFESQKIQINFWYNGRDYRYIKVTQTDLKNSFRGRNDGTYPLHSHSIVFSLTDKYVDNKYYKVVAQFLE